MNKGDNRGRFFMLNDDMTVSPVCAPHLVFSWVLIFTSKASFRVFPTVLIGPERHPGVQEVKPRSGGRRARQT